MNYDDWKLASPEYDSMVSSCCGADYEETLDAEEYEVFICDKCGDGTEVIEGSEYEENRRMMNKLTDEQLHQRSKLDYEIAKLYNEYQVKNDSLLIEYYKIK